MNDVERWVNLEGEPPPGIRELLDAGREVPELTPEEAASMESSFLEALAAQRRRRARARRAKWALGATVLIAAAAGVLMLLRGPAPPRGAPDEQAQRGVPSATAAVSAVVPVTTATATGSTDAPAVPPASAAQPAPGTSASSPKPPLSPAGQRRLRSTGNAKGSGG